MRVFSTPLAAFAGLFGQVRGNARVIVVTEGVSNLTFQWYSTFLPLYMVALGLDEVTIGWLTSANLLTQLASTLIGGDFADRFGRKRVLVVGDILCWGIPLFLYGIASNPWYLVAGRLLNGFINVVFPSFECLFVEDVAEENRPAVFGLLQFLMAAGSLLSPLAGLMVARLGMVSAGRIIMISTSLMAVAIAVARQFTLVETNMGRERMAGSVRRGLSAMPGEYLEALAAIGKDAPVRNFLIARVFMAISNVVWGTYAMIFLTSKNGAGLPEAMVAFAPALSAVVTLAALLVSADRLAGKHLFANLVIGQALWLVGAGVFLWSPAQPIVLGGVWAILNAISLALFQPASLSYWANIVSDQQRAKILAVATAVITICTLPVGPAAGYMYQLWPRMPFVVTIGLQVVVLVLILRTVWRRQRYV